MGVGDIFKFPKMNFGKSVCSKNFFLRLRFLDLRYNKTILLQKEKEKQKLHKTQSTIMMKDDQVLKIKNKSEVLYLRPDIILYIQADGNYSNIFFADGSVLTTLTYQRAEIARMMDEQLTKEKRKRFVLLGRSYMVNIDYVLRIQPSKQLLTFQVNKFGTTKKIVIKATAKALELWAKEMENREDRRTVCIKRKLFF